MHDYEFRGKNCSYFQEPGSYFHGNANLPFCPKKHDSCKIPGRMEMEPEKNWVVRLDTPEPKKNGFS